MCNRVGKILYAYRQLTTLKNAVEIRIASLAELLDFKAIICLKVKTAVNQISIFVHFSFFCLW